MKSPACPRCGNKLSKEQFLATMVVCKCGWTSQLHGNAFQNSADRSSSIGLLFWVLVFVGIVFHVMVWDSYAMKIVVPKVKQMADKATPEDLLLVALICEKREKLSCQVEALEQLVDMDPQNEEALLKLASTYRKFNEDRQALGIYEAYFSNGGQDLEAAKAYAELTGDIGDVATSRYYFRKILDSKPGVFQATVTRSYVNMLLANHQYQMAKDVILYYRNKSVNAEFFMDKELKEIRRNLAHNRGRAQ